MIAVLRSVEPLAGIGFLALCVWGVVEWVAHVRRRRVSLASYKWPVDREAIR